MTMLLIGFVVGAVTVFLGVVAGVGYTITEYTKGERKRKAEETKPICGCRHHLSFHKDGMECHAEVIRDYRELGCGCQRYIGPALELGGP
jgi:hypothetical protein